MTAAEATLEGIRIYGQGNFDLEKRIDGEVVIYGPLGTTQSQPRYAYYPIPLKAKSSTNN